MVLTTNYLWKSFIAVLVVLLLGTNGCNFFDPNLKPLSKFGAVTIPDEYGYLEFDDIRLGDDQFALAFQYLNRYPVTFLRLNGTAISDLSISLLVQLRHLKRLEVEGTHISESGIKRLRLSKSLRTIYIERGKFSPEDLKSMREYLGPIQVVEDDTWSRGI